MERSAAQAQGMKPVDRATNVLATEVYERLLDALMDGRLGPGDRLVMDRLAEELDVSRTPVRDALQRLNREGIVELADRRGYIVRALADSDVHHFYEARMAVEGFAAEMVAETADPALWKGLTGFLDELGTELPGSTRTSFDVNRRFHRRLVELAGNGYLLDMFDGIWNRSSTGLTFRDFSATNPDSDFVPEHRRLLKALKGAGRPEARAAMIDHICSGLDRTLPGGRGT